MPTIFGKNQLEHASGAIPLFANGKENLLNVDAIRFFRFKSGQLSSACQCILTGLSVLPRVAKLCLRGALENRAEIETACAALQSTA